MCTFCGLLGYTIDKCYKKHGYLVGYQSSSSTNSMMFDSCIGEYNQSSMTDSNNYVNGGGFNPLRGFSSFAMSNNAGQSS